MTALDTYWTTNRDWWHFDENLFQVINDDAPEEAKKSYEHYKEQMANLTPGAL